MKKFILALILSFCFFNLQAQTSTKKWNSYREQWEYFDSSGNMIGYNKWNSYREQWEYTDLSKSKSSSNDYIQPYDTDFMMKALESRQRQINALTEANRAKAERKKAEYQTTKQLVLDYYNSYSNYPTTVADGWHSVVVMDDVDFCDIRTVYVENNKIKHYTVGSSHRTITKSYSIQNGKTVLELEDVRYPVKIYFTHYIASPENYNSYGTCCFWKTSKKDVDIWVEGTYIGRLSHYFDTGTPNHGQNGTMIYVAKPGVYTYHAKAADGTWSGVLTIEEKGKTSKKLTD